MESYRTVVLGPGLLSLLSDEARRVTGYYLMPGRRDVYLSLLLTPVRPGSRSWFPQGRARSASWGCVEAGNGP